MLSVFCCFIEIHMEGPTSPEVYWVLTTEYSWWPAVVRVETRDDGEVVPNEEEGSKTQSATYDPTDKRVLVQLLDLNIK